MALIGDLLTKENAAMAAKVYSPETDGATIQGVGSAGNKFRLVPDGVDNTFLANMATQTLKGRTTAGTGNPEDLSKAQAQAILSVDDLIALSGVADGSTDLGTFAGSTIPDTQTIKAALQALETALEAASGAMAYDALTSGSFAADVARLGASAVTIASPATGEFNLTIPNAVDLVWADCFVSSATVNGSNETIIRINNSANSRNRRVSIQVILANTGSEEVKAFTQTVAGNITTIIIPDANGNGANGYRVLLA